MTTKKELFGEFIGTAILVFIGCGSVAVTVLFGTFSSLFEVALVWGLGVTTAIYASKKWCPAHLNPAVSIAMAIAGEFTWKKVPSYFIIQTLGGFAGGLVLYTLLSQNFIEYELQNKIIRGTAESIQTAQCFGEFFPNPGYADSISLTWSMACLWETVGTFLLVVGIFFYSHYNKYLSNFTPLLIGLTVTVIICLVAPYTQAGLNPARDFGPRVVAYLAGWGNAAFPTPTMSFFTVYMLGPWVGGMLASRFFILVKRYFL